VREARRAGAVTHCMHVGPAAAPGLRSAFDAGHCLAVGDSRRITELLLSGLRH